MTTGMSAPPIGTIKRKPNASDSSTRQGEDAASPRSRRTGTISTIRAMPSPALSTCCPGEHQRPARHQPLKLGEGDDRAGEGGQADDGSPTAISARLAAVDRPAHADAVGLPARRKPRWRRRPRRARPGCETRRPVAATPSSGSDGRSGADRAADQDAGGDEPVADHLRRRQRGAGIAIAMPAMP